MRTRLYEICELTAILVSDFLLNFYSFKAAKEYRKNLLQAILVMAVATKNLLDTVDKARIVLKK